MTFEDFLKLVLRNIGTILLCVVMGGLAAFGVLKLTPVTYTAQSTAYVRVALAQDNSSAYYSASQLALQKVKAFVPVFTSTPVAETVIKDLNLTETPAGLASKVKATNATGSLTIDVTATASNPDLAQSIADAVVRVSGDQVKLLEGASSPIEVVPMASAALSTITVKPQPLLYVALGLLIGLVIGLGVAVIRNQFDTRVRTAEDVERGFDEPVLGVLPQSKVLSRAEPDIDGDFRASEALRKLRTNLRFVNIDQELRCIIITSPGAGEGKSSVASSLARVMALAGQEVLLVEADLRRPTVGATFGVRENVGLTQVLAGTVPLEDAVASTDTPGLHVLPAGETPPNPSELLGSQRMKDLLGFLRSWYFVIVDAPPLLPVTDGALLTRDADGALVVAAARKTGTEQLRQAIGTVEQVQGRVLGIVLNGAASGRFSRLKYGDPEYGYGSYSSRYGDYRANNAKKPAATDEQAGADGSERPNGHTAKSARGVAPVNGDRPDTPTRRAVSARHVSDHP